MPWPGQISQAAPMLPTAAAQAPRPAAAEIDPFTMFSMLAPQPAKQPQKAGGVRRGLSWLFLVAVLGGLGYAGVMYGPDLVERVQGSTEDNGPSAPLVFPAATTAPTPVRSATFVVSQPDPVDGTSTYEVTADFESGVTQVVIPRTDAPGLEILSVWDQAFIRRADDAVWYSLPRGDFPIDFSMGRTRWVRTLDELLPPAMRQLTTIDEATDSSVDTLPVHRLVVSADAVGLLQAQTAAATPTTDGSAPPPAPLPPGITVQPGLDGVEGLTMEIWIDDAGIVRKSVMPAQLGGEAITVTSVSADPWEPQFPTPDTVQPLTAQALLRLGL